MRWKNFVFLSPTSFLKPDPLEILRLQVHSLAPVFHLNRPLLIRSNFFNLFLYTYPVIHFTFLTIKFITIVWVAEPKEKELRYKGQIQVRRNQSISGLTILRLKAPPFILGFIRFFWFGLCYSSDAPGSPRYFQTTTFNPSGTYNPL